ncbi:hypothetical protein CL617_03795 [archaeon]|nr:hypothetical protein [archaeon]|tara:strand:+ start:37123 stop:37605 length:483 start_codon:yes stop_codon:yes gene_type:complete
MENKCEECNKDFNSIEALEQHNRSKHKVVEEPKKESKIKRKHIVYLVLIAIIIVTLVIGYTRSAGPGKYDDFAQCLTDSDAIFYGAFWCPNCVTQKGLFGKSIDNVNYVECSNQDRSQTQICIEKGIQSYPTWIINGSEHIGVLQLQTLSELTKCPINSN